ncbi:hypothetical protein LCGC14_2963990 [marine sediment metagenome]|uniref:Uncharacterized protein n=1 Tax=marine sediment metagenome TaxID=412755 RepID=A0A0F8XBE6_9ZZZZ
MKADRSKCAIFWLVSAETQAALMQAHYDDDGTDLNIPPSPDTSSHYEATKEEDFDKIMQEKPKGMRRVD